jgi:hypothetical protein
MKYFVFYPIYPNDKVYHLLPGGCPGTLASSTTKTGRHDIAEILLNYIKDCQSILEEVVSEI